MEQETIFNTEFKRSKALSTFVPFGGQTSVAWTSWSGKENQAYINNAAVFTCVHEISTSAASVPFKVRDRLTKETIVNDLTKLLELPNPMQDRATFYECLYGHYLLKGNVGMEASPYGGNEIRELYCIPWDGNVEINLNKSGMVNSYVVKGCNGTNDKRFNVSSITGKTKLLHLKTFNPDNMWIGLSPIESAGRDVDIFDDSGLWNKNLLKNSARPSGVFSYSDKDGGILTEDAYDRLNDNIKDNYVGHQAAGVPILLEGGLAWQSTSFNPMEMDFLNSRAASARVIAAVFGYPPMLLGLSGDNTYNNQKEARLSLWTDTVMPLCDKFGEQLTAFFHRLEALDKDKYEIVPDYEEVGALQPIRDAIWEKACVKGKDIMTINERRKMVSLPEKPGYDGIVANAAQVPLDFALKDPATRGTVEIVKDNTTKKPNKNKDLEE